MIAILFAVVCFAFVAVPCVIYFVPFMLMDIYKNWRDKR